MCEGFKKDEKSYTFFLIKHLRCNGLKFDPITVVCSNLTTNCELYPRNYRECCRRKRWRAAILGMIVFRKPKPRDSNGSTSAYSTKFRPVVSWINFKRLYFYEIKSDTIGEWKGQKNAKVMSLIVRVIIGKFDDTVWIYLAKDFEQKS